MAEQQATEEVEEITTEPAVVNVEHLMAYVDEQREEGNAAFKKKRHAEALAAWSKQPLGSAPARLLCLLRARLVAPRGLRHPEREHSQLSQPPPKPPILPPLAI